MKLEFFRQRLTVFEHQVSQRIVTLELQSGSLYLLSYYSYFISY